MDKINLYNKSWESDENALPICLLIGGAAGVGKSTLMQQIAKLFAPGSIISTGTIRSILQTVYTKEQAPYLHEQTFTVHNVGGSHDLIQSYQLQCEPILRSVDKLIEFSALERQHHFIEGSHLYPRPYPSNLGVHIIDIYLHVMDADLYREMLAGPTHKRILSQKDFDACQSIQDYIIEEAQTLQKPLLESTTTDLQIILKTIADSLL